MYWVTLVIIVDLESVCLDIQWFAGSKAKFWPFSSSILRDGAR